MNQPTSIQIKDATNQDVQGIMDIYNDAVLNTTAIWNDTTVTLANRLSWMNDRLSLGYPVIVALDTHQQVLGYASFGDWRAFEGYKYTVEHSVYVRKDARGVGIGKALMQELIIRAKKIGKHIMVAGIEAQNQSSIELHAKLGFMKVGLLPEVGTKFGKWLDLVFMQLKLN